MRRSTCGRWAASPRSCSAHARSSQARTRCTSSSSSSSGSARRPPPSSPSSRMSRPCATWRRCGLAQPSQRPPPPTGPSSRWRTRSSSTSSTSCSSSTRAAARPPQRRCATRTSPRTGMRPRRRSKCPSSRWTLRGAAQARRSCAPSSGKRCCACGSQSDSRAEQRARRPPAPPQPSRDWLRLREASMCRRRGCGVAPCGTAAAADARSHPHTHPRPGGTRKPPCGRGCCFGGDLEPRGGRAATISA
mmetsp:Transcript_289/g.1005  ORF Transcript_289/g.1005 Transcript_289/m.1005 type:complete len:247 (+) Transcript_289:2-742(+)